jgi:carboxymethylenebutenolidase
MGEVIRIPIEAGEMPAWMVRPTKAAAGAVLLLHEIFGLNRNMRILADWIAALGYIALVPDLYWRQAPGVALDPDGGQTQWERAFALMRDFDDGQAVRHLKAALAAARAMPGCNGRAGTIGFCLGGRLAARMAAASDADCNVSYYGVGIEAMLPELAELRAPLLLHLAARDRFVPPAAQARIVSALAENGMAEVVVHPAADHAFARAGARSFDAHTTAVAHARTATLLERCLAS